MKVKCLFNTGKVLVDYPKKPLGVSTITQYGSLEIGKEYLVMGIIAGQDILEYLIDNDGLISTYPYPLFEILDNKLPSNWYFKALSSKHSS